MANYVFNSSSSGEKYNAKCLNVSDDSEWTPSVAEYPQDGTIDLSGGTSGRYLDTQWVAPQNEEWTMSGIYNVVMGVSYDMYSIHYKTGNLCDIYLGSDTEPLDISEVNKPYTPPTGTWKIYEEPPAIIIPPDVTNPVITMLGSSPINIDQDSVYTDAGATATDDVDGDITADIVTVNPVDTAVPAEYFVTYNVEDAAGNPANEVVRSVTVDALANNNLVINGDFTAGIANWREFAATISHDTGGDGGRLSMDITASNGGAYGETLELIDGTSYQVTGTLVNSTFTGTTINMQLKEGAQVAIPSLDGDFDLVVVCGVSNDDEIRFRRSTGDTGVIFIDNVSVKEIV